MNTFEVYNEIFNLMNKFYFSDQKKYDQMGIILGMMNPNAFKCESSADPWFYSEFKKKLEMNNPNTYTIKKGYEILLPLVESYEDVIDIHSFIDDFSKNIIDKL